MEEAATSELTEVNAPRAWAVRGTDGAIRGNVEGTIEPLEEGARSRVTISLGIETRGIGKLLVRLALVTRSQAQAEMPRNMRRLNQRLEGHA